MSIAAFMYSQVPAKRVDEITEIIRISETAYTVKGSGVVTIFKKNIDTGDSEQVQHDFNTGDYTLNHSQGQRFEVSTDGVNWINAWGIYLNGVGAYLEALTLDEVFNKDGLRYRRLNFNSVETQGCAIWSGLDDTPISSTLYADNMLYWHALGVRYWTQSHNGEQIYINSNKNVHEVSEVSYSQNHFYVDGVDYGELVSVEDVNRPHKGKFSIGKKVHPTYYKWFKGTIYNIELGTHIAQMNGQGTQIINQNGEPFLNFKGGAEWVKI